MSSDERWYPCEGFMVGQFSDGKYVPFMRGRLAKSAGGGLCWAVIPAPGDSEYAAEFATLDEAMEWARQYATTDEAKARLERAMASR